MWFTFKQVSSFLGVSVYVKSNAYSMIIKAGTFVSLQTFLGERHRHDIDSDISLLRPESIDSFPLPYLQNQTLIRWHFHQRVTWAFVWLHLPTVRWSKHTLLTGVSMCFCLSQGQVQLTSLCKILGHFSFSLRHLFITGHVFDVCRGTLWKAPGCLQGFSNAKLHSQWSPMNGWFGLPLTDSPSSNTNVSLFHFCYCLSLSCQRLVNTQRTEQNTGYGSKEWGLTDTHGLKTVLKVFYLTKLFYN